MSTTFDMRYNAAFTEKQFKVSEVLSVWCGLRILVYLLLLFVSQFKECARSGWGSSCSIGVSRPLGLLSYSTLHTLGGMHLVLPCLNNSQKM